MAPNQSLMANQVAEKPATAYTNAPNQGTQLYKNLVHMWGKPMTHQQVDDGAPISWQGVTQLFNGQRTMVNEKRIAAFMMKWGDIHARVLRLEKTESLDEIVDEKIEFEPELPARLSEFVTVPIISFTQTARRVGFLMYGLGCFFEWSSLSTPKGMEIFEESMRTLASCFALLLRLVFHSTLWKSRMEYNLNLAATGLPWMDGQAEARLSSTGWDFGTLHIDDFGLTNLASCVISIMGETMGGTTFSSVMMHTAMQSILSLANGRYKAQIIDPEMMAKVKAKGAFAIDQVMGRIIHYERDYMFRSQGNNPHEPMTTRCRFGGFGLSTNDYLKSYSDSTFYCRPNARGPGNYVPPPNTAAFRDLWYLNLGKGQVEFDKIAAVDLVDNALCFDLTDEMLPLREDLYGDIADNWKQHEETLGMKCAKGINEGEFQLSPFVYFDIDGVPQVVKYWGQQSQNVQDANFMDSAVNVTRARIVENIGGEDEVYNIKQFIKVLDDAYNIKRSLPSKNNANAYLLEALAYAVTQHKPNKPADDGSDVVRNEFGVPFLPDLWVNEKTNPLTSWARLPNPDAEDEAERDGTGGQEIPSRLVGFTDENDDQCIVLVRSNVTNGHRSDQLRIWHVKLSELTDAMLDGNLVVQYPTANPVPLGWSSYGHACSLVTQWQNGELEGYRAGVPKFDEKMGVLEVGLKSVQYLIEEAISIWGSNTNNPSRQKAKYENLFLNSHNVPAYLRVDESVYGMTGRAQNLAASVFENCIRGTIRAPLYYNRMGITNTNIRDANSLMQSAQAKIIYNALLDDLTEWDKANAARQKVIQATLNACMENVDNGQDDIKAGFPRLKEAWLEAEENGEIDADMRDDVNDPEGFSYKTFAGWFVRQMFDLVPAADAGREAELRAKADILARKVNGLYQTLVLPGTSGYAVGPAPKITRRRINEFARTGVRYGGTTVIRGTEAYRDLRTGALGQDQATAGYINTSMSVDPKYFAQAEKRPEWAVVNPLRLGDASVNFQQPLAPVEPGDADLKHSRQAVQKAARLGHGRARAQMSEGFSGYVGHLVHNVENIGVTPAMTDRQTKHRALSRHESTVGLTDDPAAPLQAYANVEIVNQIAKSGDMMNRLKIASNTVDPVAKMARHMHLGCTMDGKRQKLFIQKNLPLFLGFLVVAPFITFDMHSVYFLNNDIGKIYYAFAESAIQTDLVHFKVLVSVRFFLGAFVRDLNKFFIAPHAAFRRYYGGTEKTFVRSTPYRNPEGRYDFNVRDLSATKKCLFVLALGPSESCDSFGDAIALTPQYAENTPIRAYYGDLDDDVESSDKMREATFSETMAFNILTQFYRLVKPFDGAGTKGKQWTEMHTLDRIHGVCYRMPQKRREPNIPDLQFVRGAGPMTHMVPGIRRSIQGGSQLFNKAGTHLGSVTMYNGDNPNSTNF